MLQMLFRKKRLLMGYFLKTCVVCSYCTLSMFQAPVSHVSSLDFLWFSRNKSHTNMGIWSHHSNRDISVVMFFG